MNNGDPGSAITSDDPFIAALIEDDPVELYELAPCAYLSCLPDGTIIKVNETFVAWTGHQRDEVIGRRRIQELLPPGDRIFYETHVAPLLRMQGHVREIAVEILGRDDERLPVLVNAVAKRNAEGHPLVFRAVLFDARERRAYERELLGARQRAEESEQRARALARTLQASLLPPEIRPVAGVDVAGAFRPAGDGTVVGGDFYDVFETGRRSTAVVLGDVCGKGPEAAVLTALARHTVRAEALRTPRPAAVLRGLHDAMRRYHPDRFCTAVYVALDHAAEVKVTAAAGGHHLPLLRRARGSFEEIGQPGTILGMIDETRFSEASLVLEAGDVLVLYTDGVVEARRDGEQYGHRRLRSVIDGGASGRAQEIADGIVGAALDFQSGVAGDDIAVVVLKVSNGDG